MSTQNKVNNVIKNLAQLKTANDVAALAKKIQQSFDITSVIIKGGPPR